MSDDLRAQIDARNAEKAAISADIARQERVVAEIQSRLATARRRVADVQNRVSALKSQRAEIESRFARRVGTRSEGVEDARKQLRSALLEFARDAADDTGNYGGEFTSCREDVARSLVAQRKAAREVKLHEAAVNSADTKKVALGIGLAVGAAVLLVFFICFPFIYRSLSSPDAPAAAPAASAAPSSTIPTRR